MPWTAHTGHAIHRWSSFPEATTSTCVATILTGIRRPADPRGLHSLLLLVMKVQPVSLAEGRPAWRSGAVRAASVRDAMSATTVIIHDLLEAGFGEKVVTRAASRKECSVALVFVHGIGSRSADEGYAGRVAMRDALFREFLIPLAFPDLRGTAIRNPMWGDLAARLRWDHKSLPGDPRELLGASDSEWIAELLSSSVVEIADGDLAAAVDLLYSLVDLRARSGQDIDELAAFAMDLAAEVARDPRPAWLAEVEDDEELIYQLVRRSGAGRQAPGELRRGQEDLGGRPVRDRVRALLGDGVARLRQATMGKSARYAADVMRRRAARRSALLLGDILTYLRARGTAQAPGPIVQRVLGDLTAASAEGPLVVVAHSMGGDIVYDILTYFRPQLRVELLVTVGSQVGLFEELGLFLASDPNLPSKATPKVPKPASIGPWINITDPADFLAYRADTIFEGAEDFDYTTGAGWAHSAYFQQPLFHQRLAERARKAVT